MKATRKAVCSDIGPTFFLWVLVWVGFGFDFWGFFCVCVCVWLLHWEGCYTEQGWGTGFDFPL